jgi:predicted enzyme related to lactoylglutathione lyase
MITRLSHVTLFVKNQEEALKFYTETLGFQKRMDATFGGFRWLTVSPSDQKETEIVLLEPRSMFDAATAEKFESLMDEGKLGGAVFCTDDCQKDYDSLKTRGVKFRNAPEKKPFGIQATFVDNSNNWFSLTQPK